MSREAEAGWTRVGKTGKKSSTRGANKTKGLSQVVEESRVEVGKTLPVRIVAATMFSGIGAPECSMPHWRWAWCAEVENFPSAVLAARYPETVNLGDVNAEDFVERAEKVGRPDVIVFGSPCQDFSVAGQRVGLDGDRGNLALVALRVVKRLRPRWVVFENVPGLLSSRSGSAKAERAVREGPVGTRADGDEDSDFAAFLALVRQCGYLGCYRVTDAQFAGVPQRRRRIFAVLHLGDWRPAAAVLLEPESLRGDHPPGRAAGEGVAPILSARASAGGGLGTDFDLNGGLNESAVEVAGVGGRVRDAGLQVPVLRGEQRAGMVADVRVVRPRADREGRDGLIPDAPDVVGSVSAKWSKGSGGPAGDECYNLVADVAPTLLAGTNGKGARSYGPVDQVGSLVVSVEDVAPTLTASGNAGGGNRFPGTNVDDAVGGALVVSTLRAGAGGKGVRPARDGGRRGDAAGDRLRAAGERGDDGRGNDRGPNFSENVSPALGTVKTPVIAFDCKAGGETGFAIGDQVGALRGAGHGGGHAAIAINLRGREDGAMPELSDQASLRSASGGSSRSFVAVDVRNGKEDDVAQTIGAGGNSSGTPYTFKPSHFTRGKDSGPDDLVPPLSAEADKGYQDPVLMTGTAVRRLTPRECERLQAFPDDHTLVKYRGAPAADGPRYKALGNAMNVNEVGWVLRRIELFETTVAPAFKREGS